MIPHLLICELGICLLVLITTISGLSELFKVFTVGLGIIIGGATLAGKTRCMQLNTFAHSKLKIKI
jgi:hypothetical protein